MLGMLIISQYTFRLPMDSQVCFTTFKCDEVMITLFLSVPIYIKMVDSVVAAAADNLDNNHIWDNNANNN